MAKGARLRRDGYATGSGRLAFGLPAERNNEEISGVLPMKLTKTKISLAASVAARITCFSALNIITQLYLRELGAPRFWISMSSTLAWAAIMLFSRFWGTLSDMLSQRKSVIVIAAVGSTAGTLLLAASHSVPTVLASRFLTAAFGAGMPPAVMAFLSESGGATGRGRRMSVFTTSQAVGLLLGSVLGGWLSTVLAYDAALLAVAGISALAVLAASLVPGRATSAGISAIRWKPLLKNALPSYSAVRKSADLSSHGLGSLYLGVVLRKAGILGIYGLLMVFLEEARSLTPFVSGSLSALNPVSQALFMPLWGWAADRFSRKRVFLAGYALTLLVPLMMLSSSSIWLLSGAFVALGVGFAGFITGVTAFIGDIAPSDQEGELMGLIKVSQGIGGIFGPAVVGLVSSPSVGGYDAMFIVTAAMILAGMVITAVGTRESGPQQPRCCKESPACPTRP